MLIEKISEKSVKLTAEYETDKITNKIRTIFFDTGCIPADQVDEYEEVPYEIWCNFLPDLVPKNEVDKLNSEISKIKITFDTNNTDTNENIDIILNAINELYLMIEEIRTLKGGE